jgi:hypothetical protein
MNRRTRLSIAAATAVAAAGTASALLVPAASASATAAVAHHPPTHTVSFTSVQQAVTNFGQAASLQQDKDVNKAGKVIGYDILRFTYNPQTQAAVMSVTAGFPGGMLYGQMRNDGGSVTRGTVTGGTGAFRGAAGTITAKSLDENGTRTAVTITWHTRG